MKTVNIHEAKTHLSKLLDQVAAGEEITIARAGKPIARLAPLDLPRKPFAFGAMRGRIRIADDFDAPLPDDLLSMFESGESS